MPDNPATQFSIEAVYSDGVLRPSGKLEGLAENQRVRVTVTPIPVSGPLAGWKGDLPDVDAREMMSIIESEFGKIP